jgi:hypothetical protein
MATFAPDLRKLLVETKLVSLLHEQDVVALRQDATVESALRVSLGRLIFSRQGGAQHEYEFGCL